jgi:phosphoglycerate dehydrogenase-like enzyme
LSIVVWPNPPTSRWPSDPSEWVEQLRKAGGTLAIVTPTSEAEAMAAAPEAEGWVGRLTPALLAAAPRLRWLQTPTVSLESIMFPELAKSDVVVTMMRHIYDDHIANHVLALFLSFCRDIHRLARRQAAGEWTPRSNVRVRDPDSMTLLIVGVGGIGAEVARRLMNFRTTVLGIDPRVTEPPPGVTEIAAPSRLPDFLGRADVVAICAPQTPQTIGLFDEAMFRHMRPDAFLINIGRGKIVRLDALVRALEEKWIAGAALDVFETEPLPAASPLWKMDNVLITPHIGGTGGVHSQERLFGVVEENIRRFAHGEPLANIADKVLLY